jgi:hypothetical protein
MLERGRPKTVVSDDGSELPSNAILHLGRPEPRRRSALAGLQTSDSDFRYLELTVSEISKMSITNRRVRMEARFICSLRFREGGQVTRDDFKQDWGGPYFAITAALSPFYHGARPLIRILSQVPFWYSRRVLTHRRNCLGAIGCRCLKKVGIQTMALISPRRPTSGRRRSTMTLARHRSSTNGYQRSTSGTGALKSMAPGVIMMSAMWYRLPGSFTLPCIICS